MWQFPPRIHVTFDEWTLSPLPASGMHHHLRWACIWVCFSGLRSYEKWWGSRRQPEEELRSQNCRVKLSGAAIRDLCLIPLSYLKTYIKTIILVLKPLVYEISPDELVQTLGQDFGLKILDGSKERTLFFSNNLGKQFCLLEVSKLNELFQLGTSCGWPWIVSHGSVSSPAVPLCCLTAWHQYLLSVSPPLLLESLCGAELGIYSVQFWKKRSSFPSWFLLHRCHGCSCERTLWGKASK